MLYQAKRPLGLHRFGAIDSVQSTIVSRVAVRNVSGYDLYVIRSFAHKGLENFFYRGSLAGVQAIHAKRIRLILALLDQAKDIEDMDAPALRLHRLKGELEGMWAVTVQANWRITFRFENGDAYVVNYWDYH